MSVKNIYKYIYQFFAFLFLVHFFSTDALAQTSNFVSVNKYIYTTEQLVQNVLFDSGLNNISAITASAGNINGNYGIGYFNKNNSNFPIQEGVIIRSGRIEYSEGPFFKPPGQIDQPPMSSKASNIGDSDLQAVSDAIPGNTQGIRDVSYLQFDFVPLFNEFSFDFLFASNEYGQWQCSSFNDVFAFLLKDLSVPGAPYINLAVIPGTSVPVSTRTIRDALYNSGCASANETFFGQFNEWNPTTSAINFSGQTIVMQAISPVVAGHTYRIKLAVGDYEDHVADSAVFISGGSFKSTNPCLQVPTAMVIQPTCDISTGEIIITSPLGTDLTYSIDGVNFQSAPTFNNLVPGTYSVTARNAAGCASATPDIVINAAPAAPSVASVSVAQPTCTVSTGTITIDNPLGVDLAYSIDGIGFQPTPTFSNLAPGTYTVTVRNAIGCTSITPDIIINVAPLAPAIANAAITQPTCTVSTGTITVDSPLGADLTYSINGVDFQAAATFGNLAPGTYTITVRNADGCTSVTPDVVINAAPTAPPIAGVSVTQPTCTVSTGTITIDSPLGADLTYSINGVDFQAATTFGNLAPGTYTVTVQNAAGCTSATPDIVINAAPTAPPIAGVSVTQPTCTVSIGTITVDSPLGADLTYSINGVDFQTGTTFGNLAPGTYTITVRNAAGCTSITPDIIINVAPLTPAIANTIVTQPSCTVSIGTITVDSPLGTNLTYSINGVDFQSTPTFSNLAPGTYTVTVKNADGCTSATPDIVINAVPVAPAVATATVVQPTCIVSMGTITIDSPLGTGLTYSINGVDFQAAATFSNLAPGTYTVTVRNAAGCTSITPDIIINIAPLAPAIANTIVAQPTCTVSIGTITVDSPLGAGLTYSIDGIGFQPTPTFSNLASGTYTVTVKNADGCTSITPDIIINVAPLAPAIANTAVTQSTCTIPTGTITVGSPLGADLTYSINGIDFQTGTTFSNLASGTYTVTVKNAAGCTSITPDIIINIAPLAPAIANTIVAQPTCTVPTGTITINSPLGAGLTYSINGVDFQTDTAFNNVAPGIYKVTVQNNNCRSVSPNITIDAPPNRLPPINAPIELQQCDTDGQNDGFFVFDLTQVETDVLGGQNPNVYDITYHLSEVDAHSGVNPIADPATFENTIADTQIIWMRISNILSTEKCDNVISINVEVERLPVPVIQGGTICVDFNTDTTLRPLTIGTSLDDASYDFVWFLDGVPIPNETGTTLIAGKPGKYKVQAISRSANGCVSYPVEEVTVVRSGAAIPIGLGYNIKNVSGGKQIITVKVQGYGIYEYSLNDGPWQLNPVFTNVSPGDHIIKVRDTNADACDELVIEVVNKIDFPNFFTPNGDGFHDVWNIYSLRGTGAVIYIFDRYGKIIKQISPDKDGWNGTINGEQAPATDYWFTVTYPEFNGTTTEAKEFKSHFSLKR